MSLPAQGYLEGGFQDLSGWVNPNLPPLSRLLGMREAGMQYEAPHAYAEMLREHAGRGEFDEKRRKERRRYKNY